MPGPYTNEEILPFGFTLAHEFTFVSGNTRKSVSINLRENSQ